MSVGPHPNPLPGKQFVGDSPGLQADRVIQHSFVELSQKARFLASVAPHSGDWLLALPIANSGLRGDLKRESGKRGTKLQGWKTREKACMDSQMLLCTLLFK